MGLAGKGLVGGKRDKRGQWGNTVKVYYMHNIVKNIKKKKQRFHVINDKGEGTVLC